MATIKTAGQALGSNSSAGGITTATTIPSDRTRRSMTIQCSGTTVCYVLLGSGTPSSSNYHFALPACTAENDGSGGTVTLNDYTGPLVIGAKAHYAEFKG